MRRILVIAAASAVIAACSVGDDASRVIETSEIAADIPVLDGSTSTRPLRMFVICAILEASCDWGEWIDGSRVVLPDPGVPFEPFSAAVPSSGTHGSYVALVEGRADLILVARQPSEDEVQLAESHGVDLDISPIALDAFVFLVNAANQVDGLDLEQVRGIFSGVISNWTEVGGGDLTIQPYLRNETSGSQVLMDELVMKGTSMIDAPDMILLTMMAPFDAISGDREGIGYSVYYFATHMLATDEVRVLEIEGVRPGPDTIASGDYPIVTEVYAVLRSQSPSDSAPRMLRAWLTSEPGRSVIEESGYVPLP